MFWTFVDATPALGGSVQIDGKRGHHLARVLRVRPGEHGVESRGGWIQAQFNFTPRWQTNLSYGLDAQNATNLRVGDRDKNQTYMANLMYKFSPNVTFAWEYRRFLTRFRNQPAANENGDHLNMAVGYVF